MSNQIGCRVPWDSLSSIEVCDSNEKFAQYYQKVTEIFKAELKIITKNSGCLIPCIFRDYKLEWDPMVVEDSINGE